MIFYQTYLQILNKNHGGIRLVQTLKNEIKKKGEGLQGSMR